MVDLGIAGMTLLMLISALLLYLQRWVLIKLSDNISLESSGWTHRFARFKAETGAQVLLSFMLVVSIGSIIGVIVWIAINTIAPVIAFTPSIYVASMIGSSVSIVSFGLFSLALSMFGPILSFVYENWTVYIAPVVGGTIGTAIGGGLINNMFIIVVLSVLTGGITLVVYEMIGAKETNI